MMEVGVGEGGNTATCINTNHQALVFCLFYFILQWSRDIYDSWAPIENDRGCSYTHLMGSLSDRPRRVKAV